MIWDPQTRKVEREFNETGPIESAGFSKSGTYVITGSDNMLAKVWDTRSAENSRRVLCQMTGHTGKVEAVALNPMGGTALTGSDDYTAKIWDIDLCVSAYGDRPEAQCRWTLTGHTGKVNAVAYSPYGRWVVTASNDYTARLWNHHTGDPIRVFGENPGTQHMSNVTSVAWKPPPITAKKWDKQHDQVLTGGEDGKIKLWMVHTGELIQQFDHGAKVTSVAWNFDGSKIVSGAADGTAKVWNVISGALISSMTGSSVPAVNIQRQGNRVRCRDPADQYCHDQLVAANAYTLS